MLIGILSDVHANATALDRLCARQRPDVVFHAAAYKHVPLLQDQVLAALANNVLGTRTIAAAEVPFGEGADPFFSATIARPGSMYSV